MTISFTILAFLLGTIIGSFLSVLIFRVKKGKKGILTGRSVCPYCKNQLKLRYMVPLFSWLFLRGKCGYCGKRISSHYFLLELMTGLLFAIAFLKWDFLIITPSTITPQIANLSIDWNIFSIFIFQIIMFTFFSLIFFYDLLYKEIPDRFSLTAAAIALAGGFSLETHELSSMLIGAAIIAGFFLIQFLASKGRWIGGGDIRIGLIMGFYLGFEHGILALILAYAVGSLVSITLLLQRRVKGKTEIAFGPFLIIGTLIAVFYGEQILNWYWQYAIV